MLYGHFDQTKLHIKAWELLCERIENYMREHHNKHRAIIIADDVSPQENLSLANSHAYFIEKKTSANIPLRRIIEMPFFVRSNLSEGVQLADLCAYNIYHYPDWKAAAHNRTWLSDAGAGVHSSRTAGFPSRKNHEPYRFVP